MPSPDPSPQRRSRNKAQAQPESAQLTPLAAVHDPLKHPKESNEFYDAVFKIFKDVDNNRPFILTERAKSYLQGLDMFEWSAPYPADLPERQVPFFTSDLGLHQDLVSAYEQVATLARTTSRDEQRAQKRRSRKPEVTQESPEEKAVKQLQTLQGKIDHIYGQLYKRHNHYNVLVGDEHMRFSPFGRTIRDGMAKMTDACAVLLLKALMRIEDIDPSAKIQWRKVLEHGVKLSKLADPELHLRKFNVGIIQKSIDLTGENLERRFRQIEVEGFTDLYLQAPRSSRGQSALRWLQSVNGGNYCPPPYPSWQAEEKKACVDDCRRIVTGARLHSYTLFQKLRMENRHLCGGQPLIHRFGQDTHEQFMLAHGRNIDVPPGRGFFMAGPRLERLFHGDPMEPDDSLINYRDAQVAWWEKVLPDYESTSGLFLRGWFAIFNPTPDFELFGQRYAIVVDNNHFSDLYGCAYGIPSSIITKKVQSSLHNPQRKPTKRTPDIGAQDASVSGLIEATVDAKLPPLVLGTMSQLFGGMVNALPVGTAPFLSWERDRQGGMWKDAYNHVHWSWLVWDFRESRPHVDFKVSPMAEVDQKIRRFANKGQQLIQLTFDRYAAWKNDLTPGLMGPPLMLSEAYRIHKGYKENHPSLPKDETIYIGLYDQESPGGDPTPVINCRTLQIMRSGGNIQLPMWSDGTENAELVIWKQYVKPLLISKDKTGVVREGRYELAIIGDKDIKDRRYDTTT
jgi:hypothetical protein